MRDNIVFIVCLLTTMAAVWWTMEHYLPDAVSAQQTTWVEVLVADDPYSPHEHGTLVNEYLTTVDPSCIIGMDHEVSGRYARDAFYTTFIERRC